LVVVGVVYGAGGGGAEEGEDVFAEWEGGVGVAVVGVSGAGGGVSFEGGFEEDELVGDFA
jgi:hypothetical protein